MTNFVEYWTKQNDRLDLIANQAFGNPYDVGPIISANPSLPIQAVYSSGIRLLIPIQNVPTTTATANAKLLPPWKR